MAKFKLVKDKKGKIGYESEDALSEDIAFIYDEGVPLCRRKRKMRSGCTAR